MPYDYSKLSGRIVEKYGTQAKFADAMNLSERSISLKLNGKVGWKQDEITKACNALGLVFTENFSIFFAIDVQYRTYRLGALTEHS